MASDFSHRRLSSAARTTALGELVARARDAKTSTSVVFDLDGTLMDNRPRMVAILHELAEHWHQGHPEAASKLAGAHVDDIVYDFVGNLRRVGIEDDALHQRGAAFWKDRFFSDPYMGHDVALPGSVDFVHQLYEAGANIVYLTGRDLPNMAVGTFASLRDLGFPIGRVGTGLVTKPDFDTPDETFKKSVAAQLQRMGDVIAVFDNEPANCNLLLMEHPETAAVFVDTLHAPNPPALHEAVIVIETFET